MTDPTHCGRCGRPHAGCTGHRKQTGEPCGNTPMHGQRVCRMHGGGNPKAKAAAERRLAEVEVLTAWSARAAANPELPELIDPAAAVMGLLHMSWLRVHIYAQLLEAQVNRDGLQAPAGRGVAVSYVDADDAAADSEYAPLSGGAGVAAEGGTSGLIGHTYGAAGKDGRVYAQGEALRALVTLEAQERDRCVKFAEAAHRMGIAQRELELAESQARAVVVAHGAALGTFVDELVRVLGREVVAQAVVRAATELSHQAFLASLREQARVVEA